MIPAILMLQRKVFSGLIALVFIFWSAPLWAAPFTGGTLTIDLPEGWKAGYDEQIRQIMAESADGTARVAIQVTDSDGLNDKQLAEMLSRDLGGTTPVKVEGFDNYYFNTRLNDMEMTITLFEMGGKVLVYIEGGDTIKYEKDTARIWNSMTSSDPAEKALLEALSKA